MKKTDELKGNRLEIKSGVSASTIKYAGLKNEKLKEKKVQIDISFFKTRYFIGNVETLFNFFFQRGIFPFAIENRQTEYES